MKRAFFIMFLVLASGMVLAESYDITIQSVKTSILSNESAVYNVSITNFQDVTDRFTMYSQDVNWIISPTQVSVSSSEVKHFQLTITPIVGTPPQNYLVPLTFSSAEAADRYTTKPLAVFLKDANELPIDYAVNLGLDVSIPEQVDPRDRVPVEIKLKNRNGRVMDVIRVQVRSPLLQTKEYITGISGWEEKTNTLLIDIPQLQEPGTYTIDVAVFLGNESIASATSQLTVIGYSTLVKAQEDTTSFLRYKHVITVKNIGNYQKRDTLTYPVSWFGRIFTTTIPEAHVAKEKGVSGLAWDVLLNPEETYKVTVVTSYRLLFFIILIIILIIVAYFVLRSPIVVFKKAKVFGPSFEGISNMTVKVFVRNRSGRAVHGVHILERIPSLADILDESSLGTLKPTKVYRRDKVGSLARWDLGKIDSYEERIISYKLKSKLKIVGDITLPPAKARFDMGHGKQREVYSEPAVIIHPLNDKHKDDDLQIRKI